MTSQHRIQQYMEKHKIARLFEDLMNKVIHDQPDEPLLYLIKVLCKKAGKDVPAEAKLSHLRRSTSDLPRVPGSPEQSRKNRTGNSAWASASPDPLGRSYDRPWLANTKRTKSKKPGESEDPVRPVSAYIRPSLGPTLSPTIRRASLDEFLRIKPISPGRRQKTEWNPDTKVVASNFDELFDEAKGSKPALSRGGERRKAGPENSRRAWASYGLGEGEENLFTSSGYQGPKRSETEDPLAGELINAPHRRAPKGETIKRESASSVSSRVKGPRLQAERHRQELEKIVNDADRRSTDSGIYDDNDQAEDDDAIELLEDAETLRKEGVKNVPSKGYRLSKTVRQADPEVKLNINLYTGSGPVPSEPARGMRYGDLPEFDDSDRDGSLIGSRYTPESDEEFESVSQVTGPRHPIWNTEDSDGEAPVPRPPLSSPHKAVTMAFPSRSEDFDRSSSWDKRLVATVPLRSADLYTGQSLESSELFSTQYRPEVQHSMDSAVRQSGDMYGGSAGGWAVRDGSDVSISDWKGAQRARVQKARDYRSY